jgi:hypothetical protein
MSDETNAIQRLSPIPACFFHPTGLSSPCCLLSAKGRRAKGEIIMSKRTVVMQCNDDEDCLDQASKQIENRNGGGLSAKVDFRQQGKSVLTRSFKIFMVRKGDEHYFETPEYVTKCVSSGGRAWREGVRPSKKARNNSQIQRFEFHVSSCILEKQ